MKVVSEVVTTFASCMTIENRKVRNFIIGFRLAPCLIGIHILFILYFCRYNCLFICVLGFRMLHNVQDNAHSILIIVSKISLGSLSMIALD